MQQIRLDEARRDALREALQRHFRETFDETLSDFRADGLIALMIRELGPAVYNQAVHDVRAHLQTRLDDLDGEVYVDPEP